MSSDTIILRRAEETDLAALVRLRRRSRFVTWAPHLPFEAAQDPARSHIERVWPFLVVASIGGELIGMLHVENDRVEHLHVDPKAWGQGVGSRLMDEAERRIAEAHGAARLEVRAFNERARGFYGRRGWIETQRYSGLECGNAVENIEMCKAF